MKTIKLNYYAENFEDIVLCFQLKQSNLIEIEVIKISDRYIKENIPTQWYYPFLSSLEYEELYKRVDLFISKHFCTTNDILNVLEILYKENSDLPNNYQETLEFERDFYYHLGKLKTKDNN